MGLGLGRNKYFNAYANRQTKRSSQTSSSSSSNTNGCVIVGSEPNYVETCTYACIDANGNETGTIGSASSSHIHDGVGPCVTTLIDCNQATTTITSTPDGTGTYTVTIVYPDGRPDKVYLKEYFHGISTPYV